MCDQIIPRVLWNRKQILFLLRLRVDELIIIINYLYSASCNCALELYIFSNRLGNLFVTVPHLLQNLAVFEKIKADFTVAPIISAHSLQKALIALTTGA